MIGNKRRGATQPAQPEGDANIGVRIVGDDFDRLRIWVYTDEGEIGAIEISEYNAWVLIGYLMLMLRIPLPSRLAAKIKLPTKDGKWTLKIG